MREIKFFLEKFKNIASTDAVLKQVLINAIKHQTNITLTLKDLKFQNGIMFLTAKPIMKSEIFLKHEAIMAEVESLLTKSLPKKLI